MKTKAKKRSVQLREQGRSIGEIAKEVGVSKSSVSLWVRDVLLTKKQRQTLNTNGHSVDAIEKRRLTRLANTKRRRDELIKNAREEAESLSKDPLWCLGVGLYWGEGGKTQQTARLSNSDPYVIKKMMRFFRETCNIPEEKFRGHIHTFSHNNVLQAEKYWSEISDIPVKRFFKTYAKQSRASKNKRKTLPYGTFQIYIHDTKFFFRMMGWIEYMKTDK